MTTEVPFSEAERVFNKVQDLVESHVEQRSPGAREISMSFAHAGDATLRNVRVDWVAEDGSRPWIVAICGPGYASGVDLFRLDLTSQEDEVFHQLVLLGACAGFWHVEGLVSIKGQVQRHGTMYDRATGRYQPPKVEPLAILAAFAGGALAEMWPERARYIEKGWFIWQALHRASDDHPKGAWAKDDTPDYLG
jgi:hypothetical protein